MFSSGYNWIRVWFLPQRSSFLEWGVILLPSTYHVMSHIDVIVWNCRSELEWVAITNTWTNKFGFLHHWFNMNTVCFVDWTDFFLDLKNSPKVTARTVLILAVSEVIYPGCRNQPWSTNSHEKITMRGVGQLFSKIYWFWPNGEKHV